MSQGSGKAVGGGKRQGETDSSLPGPRWRGTVPVVPSNNEFIRTHWAERKRVKDIFYLELYAAFAHDMPTKATAKRKVRIHVFSKRVRDELNLAGPIDKFLVDNIVKLGWLVDDNREYMEIELLNSASCDTRCEVEIWGDQK